MKVVPFQLIKPTAVNLETVDYKKWNMVLLRDDKAEVIIQLNRDQLALIGNALFCALSALPK